jgi:hypothetical protein
MKYRSKLLELHSFVKIAVLLKVTPCMLQLSVVDIIWVILFVSKRHTMISIGGIE